MNRDLEIVRDMRDISYQRTNRVRCSGAFLISRAQEGVAGHHLFDDDLTVLALAGFRARCACCAPCASLLAATATPHLPSHRSRAHGHARAKSVPRIPEHTTKFERLFDGVSGRKTEPEYAKFRTISGPKRKSRPPRYSGRPALTSISPAGLAYHEVYTVLGHQSLSMNTVRTWPRNSSYLPVPAWASPYAPSS